ncbi:MAG: tetratricopeptide repeat protein [Deltaproteobacteria bacterium]|nr:tetratricopeptide repeat protein [Deltaproteobacteria bacterium]
MESNKAHAEEWSNQGFKLLRDYWYKDALRDFQKAIELDQNLAEAWYGKGNAIL